MLQTDVARLRRAPVAAIGAAALLLLLASCNAASPSSGGSTPGASGGGGGTARCEATPDATAAATIAIANFKFGDEVTVQAGEAVAFTNNDGTGHTVTEGTNGRAADGACVDESVAAGSTVTVTFSQAGDFDITCKIHPGMHTAVHVQ
ncbi:MAG TPA: plastocyanin/azurin family copper-binding protein [Candidatus Limnocylindria bacterium]